MFGWKRKKRKPITGWRRWLVLAVVPAIVVFAVGFYAGKYGIPPRDYVAGNRGKAADLNQFFQVKKTIEDRYPNKVNTQDLITGATSGLVQGLGDPYSVYLNKSQVKDLESSLSGEVEGIGVEIGLQNNKATVIAPVAGSPAEQAGIKAGDVITAVGDDPTDGLTIDEVADKIRGDKGTQVNVTVQSPGETTPRTLTIARDTIKSPAVTLTYRDDIAIIELSRYGEDTMDELNKAVTDIQANHPKGIVLDLRSNPGGFLDGAVSVSGVFLKEGVAVKEQFKDKTETQSVKDDGRLADIPLVVLVNRGTASAAEITAGALRDNRHIPLIGERTYGKGSVQELIHLDAGAVLKLTIAEWLTPNGTSISKEGLKPDVDVSSDNPDAQLNAAIEKLQ
ncbi:S41 family peptidase [Patescibacteria group bacterium]|nr:S41 family peptidase [Patescibacteria group bacterium]